MGKLADTAPAKPDVLCPIGRLLASPDLDTDDVAALTSALAATSDISNASIIRWLGANDVRFSKDTVAKHRAGDCRCTPAA